MQSSLDCEKLYSSELQVWSKDWPVLVHTLYILIYNEIRNLNWNKSSHCFLPRKSLAIIYIYKYVKAELNSVLNAILNFHFGPCFSPQPRLVISSLWTGILNTTGLQNINQFLFSFQLY